jgi:hypothetical protein
MECLLQLKQPHEQLDHHIPFSCYIFYFNAWRS